MLVFNFITSYNWLSQSLQSNDAMCEGDGRVNENPGITSYHTVFIRQHNLLEEGLHLLNPNWNGDRLFQETRRIVGAILQHVTYNELLPVLVGQKVVQDYQLNLETQGYYGGKCMYYKHCNSEIQQGYYDGKCMYYKVV